MQRGSKSIYLFLNSLVYVWCLYLCKVNNKLSAQTPNCFVDAYCLSHTSLMPVSQETVLLVAPACSNHVFQAPPFQVSPYLCISLISVFIYLRESNFEIFWQFQPKNQNSGWLLLWQFVLHLYFYPLEPYLLTDTVTHIKSSVMCFMMLLVYFSFHSAFVLFIKHECRWQPHKHDVCSVDSLQSNGPLIPPHLRSC